jgi:hypothetical protein
VRFKTKLEGHTFRYVIRLHLSLQCVVLCIQLQIN